MASATWNCCYLSTGSVYTIQVLCTPYNHAPCHFIQSHIHKMYACLAVTCHLHFWQNDWDLLHATVVTRGRNRYWNKSQHRKLTLEKKTVLPLLLGFKPATFQSWVWQSNHWAIPVPKVVTALCHCILITSRQNATRGCLPCIGSQNKNVLTTF